MGLFSSIGNAVSNTTKRFGNTISHAAHNIGSGIRQGDIAQVSRDLTDPTGGLRDIGHGIDSGNYRQVWQGFNETAGPDVGGEYVRPYMTKHQAPQPSNHYAQLQQQLIRNQLLNAKNFDINDYVTGEAGALRRQLAQDVAMGRRNVKAEANARGMLNSGQRLFNEGTVARTGEEAYQSGTNDMLRGATQLQQTLNLNPAMSAANLKMALQRQQQALDQIELAKQNARAQLFAGSMGMVGQGLGTMAANNYAGYSPTSHSPYSPAYRSSYTMPSMPAYASPTYGTYGGY